MNESNGKEHKQQEVSRRRYLTQLEPSRRGFITNYPDFQHWKRATINDVAPKKNLNIYVHIPYCAQKCSYCYYRTIQGGRKSEIDYYVDTLCKEVEIASKRFHLDDRTILSVYFGGGTPTLLGNEHLLKIKSAIDKYLKPGSHEFTVEAEPITLTESKASALKELGVNRISLGVQSLSDEIIKLSNRKDTEKRVLLALEIAQTTGAQVNIDLMSGLAGETMETWAYSIKRALASGVESITVYKTELYANSEYFKEIRKENLVLPDDEQELQFMQHALDEFAKANYLPWSFFTFTKNGQYPHIHAPSIWRGDDYYPFGTSAFGRINGCLFQNTNENDKYIAAIGAGEIAVNRAHQLTSMDCMVRDAVLGMKLMRLDLHEFKRKHGIRLDKICSPVIDKLLHDNFIVINQDEITLTQKGILHGDYTGKSLGRYLIETYTR